MLNEICNCGAALIVPVEIERNSCAICLVEQNQENLPKILDSSEVSE